MILGWIVDENSLPLAAGFGSGFFGVAGIAFWFATHEASFPRQLATGFPFESTQPEAVK